MARIVGVVMTVGELIKIAENYEHRWRAAVVFLVTPDIAQQAEPGDKLPVVAHWDADGSLVLTVEHCACGRVAHGPCDD